jgi:uracil-DNA glycosylase
VDTLVATEVDPLACARDPRDERVDDGAVVADEREDGAIVVRVDVDVEQLRALGQRAADRLHDRAVAALREIRHRFERQLHFRDDIPVTTRRSSYRSLASLQRDTARCRACAEAGFPLESLPVRAPFARQRAYMFGQAPGIVEGAERRPWRGRAGQTLRRWLGLEEDAFYATFFCASVTRCYPGRAPAGRGDRTPTPREQDLCEFWRDRELELIRPGLIVTVGGLALKRILGRAQLTECIGCRFEWGGVPVVPLPHPSGASSWPNLPANRVKLDAALALVHDELGRLARSARGPA